MLMLDRDIIQGRGFRNVMDGDRITGFQFQLRNPNYRGTSASLLDGIDVTIDGEKIPDHLPVWTVQGTDPSAKGKNTGQVVKIAADYQPVPPETLAGTPFRPAMFHGLKVTPYVRDGWVSYTVWADEMVSPQAVSRNSKAAQQKPDASSAAA